MENNNHYAPKRESGPEKSTGSMRYVKMYVGECLEGTIRFDFEPAERGVWYDLVILAGRMRVKGLIGAGSGVAYPRRWIAGILNIDEELLERTIEKCKNTQRISENSDGILILNWSKYQSEYDRQKPYRDKKKVQSDDQGWHPPKICHNCGGTLSGDYPTCRCDEREE